MSDSQRTTKDEELSYICGQCNLEQYYVKGAAPPVPCVDCGWIHKERKKYDLPSEIRLNLSQY